MTRKEEQLDLIPAAKKRGGARPGAGRKASNRKTKAIRVPEAYIPAVEALVAFLDEQQDLTKHHTPETSDEIWQRSLKGQRQVVTITVEGK